MEGGNKMSDTPETDAISCSDGVEMLTAQSDSFALYQQLCEATARIYQWENDFDLMKRERDEIQEKYDTLAVENMLEVNKICKQRDKAIDALMKIEEIFLNGNDAHEDWKSMGQIARTFLEKTYESRTN